MENILREELKEGLEKLKTDVNETKVIGLTKTFNCYLSDKSKEIMCKKAHHTLVETWDDYPEGERKWNLVQYIGVTKTISNEKDFEQRVLDGVKHIAELINYCVEKEYVFYGFLVTCILIFLKTDDFSQKVLIVSYPVTKQGFGNLGKRLIEDGKMKADVKTEIGEINLGV
jgi:hypothetical protein